MAIISRSCGGWPKLPFGLAQWLFAIPFMGCAFAALGDEIHSYRAWILILLSGVCAFAGKRTGHGRGISLFEPLQGKPEKLEWLIIWALPPVLPLWLYKCCILAICEALVWSGVAYTVSSWFLLGAFIRPLSYLLGWGIYIWADKTGRVELRENNDGKRAYKAIPFLPKPIDHHTAIGEAMTGLLDGCYLLLILYTLRVI